MGINIDMLQTLPAEESVALHGDAQSCCWCTWTITRNHEVEYL